MEYWNRAKVVMANWYDFGCSSSLSYSHVQSRYLVWCRSGKGTIEVNGVPYDCIPGSCLFLPWNHDIIYRPHPRKPLFIGSIHVIPVIPEDDLFHNAFHAIRPQYEEYNRRRDELLPEFTDTFFCQLPLESALFRLSSYVIDRYQRACPEWLLRLFPRELLYELLEVRRELANGRKQYYPAALQNILNLIDASLESSIDAVEMSSFAKISIPTVYREFRRHFNTTPGEFVTRRRLQRAVALLRETKLPIAEISSRLQFSSPFYFSRRFKQYFGITPSECRRSENLTLPEDLLQRVRTSEDLTFRHSICHFVPDRISE